MNIFFKQFATRRINLNSNLDADALDAEMREFCKCRFWNLRDNLTGRLRSDGRFTFSRKWEIGVTTVNGISTMPSLRAKIIAQDTGCLVQVSMPTPFVSIILVAVFIFAGLIVLLTSIFTTPFDSMLLVLALIFLLLIPAGLAYQNNWRRSSLVAAFAEIFELYQV